MSKVLTLNFRNYMVLGVLAAAALGGCVRFESSDTPEALMEQREGQDGKKAAQANACEAIKKNYNEDSARAENIEQKITIERHYKRVVRKDCDGHVTSNEIETVKSPHYDVDFKVPGSRKFLSVFVFNEATCDHVLTTMPASQFNFLNSIYGDGRTKLTVRGDLAPAPLTFRLKEGMNNIFVRYFYDCDATRGAGSSLGNMPCDESSESLLVQYPVYVNYVPTELPGVDEIPTSPASCAATANK